MSFYWFLDIQESSDVHTNVNTEVFPAPDTHSAGASTFSIGPIKFQKNEKTTVHELIGKIQEAFSTAYKSGVAPRLYQIEARIRRIALSDLAGYTGAQSVPIERIKTAREGKELHVEYRIFNEDAISFSILFRSGPHGSAGGLASFPTEGPPVAEIIVDNKRHIEAMQVPYCSVNAMVTDKPPVPPDINFIPYVGVNNKIAIMFNSNAGSRIEKPIMLKDSDVRFLLEEYFAQHNISIEPTALTDEDLLPLEYKNDDPIRKYELFRVTKKPTGYADFRGHSVTTDPITAQLGPDKFSTAVNFIDTIRPNKKYWYCARSMDIHENISNPTHIFELEMVDNRGQMYLKTKIFSFDAPKPNFKRSGQRFIAITPATEQLSYVGGYTSPGTVGINSPPTDNILGTADRLESSSVWGKKFKVRLTSKKTGRKIDLNLTFKNTGVVIP
tara:strand:+ start:12240 stop:13565 length:1326 start_codon:yes stop_codon:yes gene_type:complete